MDLNESQTGNVALVVDEQDLAGDHANGTGGMVNTLWESGYHLPHIPRPGCT